LKRNVEGSRFREDPGVRDNSDNAAQNQIGKPERCFGVQYAVQPIPVLEMVFCIGAMSVNEHINVD